MSVTQALSATAYAATPPVPGLTSHTDSRNDQALKLVTENGWFAARPSGIENVHKVYAESFRGAKHLEQILAEAHEVVRGALEAAAQPA